MALTGSRRTGVGFAAKGKKPDGAKPAQNPSQPLSLPSANLSGQNASTLDTVAVALIKWLLNPVVIVASLFGCALFYGQDFMGEFLSLAIVAFLLASHIFDEANLYRQQTKFPLIQAFYSILLKWMLLVGCLWVLGMVTNMAGQFPRKPLLAWFAVTPVALLVFNGLSRLTLRAMVAQGKRRSAIIVGANPLGYDLYNKINNDAYLGIQVLGFFDDRAEVRLPTGMLGTIFGPMGGVTPYVWEHNIDLVYISLPMQPNPRVLNLMDALRDSTASVYFVPDMFMFDLITDVTHGH